MGVEHFRELDPGAEVRESRYESWRCTTCGVRDTNVQIEGDGGASKITDGRANVIYPKFFIHGMSRNLTASVTLVSTRLM